MELVTLTVVLVIALALFFDFTNGFHDTANAMATPIATGALKPRPAVALAAILNLIGALLSTEVAKTVSGGRWIQSVVATPVLSIECSWSAKTSAGVLQPRTFRGRLLSVYV